MATIMSKRGDVDNVVTYEHYCDTVADLDNIPYNESTLGSVAVVLVGESDGLEIYIANSNHEWIPLVSGGGGGDITVEELNITENGAYTAPSGKAYSPVNVNIESLEDAIITRTISGTYSNSRITKVGPGAFEFCEILISVNLPNCLTLEDSAFAGAYRLTTINCPKCQSIGYAAFESTNLIIADFPSCISMSQYAFRYCSKLTSVNMPLCSSVGYEAFNNCVKLESINFQACTTIGAYAFQNCKLLTSVDFPNCTTIGTSAFQKCNSLNTISFPMCTTINSSAFTSCTNLTYAYFPNCISIASYAFTDCSKLNAISFPNCTKISGYAFYRCYRLLSAYFLGSSVPTLVASSAFYQTPINGYSSYTGGVLGTIYVRASLLTSFQSATNWAYFSERMVGLTDEQIAALS